MSKPKKSAKPAVNTKNYDARRQAALAKLRADRLKAEEDAKKEVEKTPEQVAEESEALHAAIQGLADAVKPEEPKAA